MTQREGAPTQWQCFETRAHSWTGQPRSAYIKWQNGRIVQITTDPDPNVPVRARSIRMTLRGLATLMDYVERGQSVPIGNPALDDPTVDPTATPDQP